MELSLEFSGQEYWSELPFPPPGDLPNPGIKPGSPTLQAASYHLSHQGIFEKRKKEEMAGRGGECH